MRLSSLYRVVLISGLLPVVAGCAPPEPEPEVRLPPPADAVTSPVGPSDYKVRFETTQGDFVVQVHREWAPFGADRFYELVTAGFYDDQRFYRVVRGFVVQWGLSGDPKVTETWITKRLPDDIVSQSNTRGRITFASSGEHSRTTNVFVNLGDNSNLDKIGFPPFGEVVEGMDVIGSFYGGYLETQPRGPGPSQQAIIHLGNEYLDEHYPKLDRLLRAYVIEREGQPVDPPPARPARDAAETPSDADEPQPPAEAAPDDQPAETAM